MTRLHYVKKARKSIPGTGVKKGEPYYWWKFRHGGKRVSVTKPPRSALTQSEFYGQMWDAEDAFNAAIESASEASELAAARDEAVETLRGIAEECEAKHSNMESYFQGGEVMELLESRAERCNEIADELENIDLDEVENAETEAETAREAAEAAEAEADEANQADAEDADEKQTKAEEARTAADEADEEAANALQNARDELTGVDWSAD